MSIALDIITTLEREMKAHSVSSLKSLKVKVGEMTAVEPDSLRFCFEAAIEKTPLEGARLIIEEVPLKGRCSNCEDDFSLNRYFTTPCPSCGGKASEVISGRELDIVCMEVE